MPLSLMHSCDSLSPEFAPVYHGKRPSRGVQQKCTFCFKLTHYAALVCLWSLFLRNTYRWRLFLTKLQATACCFAQKIDLFNVFFQNCCIHTLLRFFLIRIHCMQGLTVTTRHGVTRKKRRKRLKHTGNLFTKNLQLKDVC